MRKIAISDIHGHLKTFQHLVEKVLCLDKKDQLFLLGDYVNYGKNSVGVLDYIIYLRNMGFKVSCILGNHDNDLLIKNDNVTGESRNPLQKKYYDFLKGLDFFYQTDDFVMVHAGLNLSIPNPFEDRYTMIHTFGFELFKPHELLDYKRVIHGHDVRDRDKIIQSVEEKRGSIGIDNGIFRKEPGYGTLCAFDFENWGVYFQENFD